jgi:hypothetical protein
MVVFLAPLLLFSFPFSLSLPQPVALEGGLMEVLPPRLALATGEGLEHITPQLASAQSCL